MQQSFEPGSPSVAQNLLDAGCDAAFIRQYAQLKGLPEQLLLLRKHRRTLLDRIHEEQHRLDCLDYLIYMTSKTQK